MSKLKNNPFQDFTPIESFAVLATPQNMSYVVNVDEEFEHPRQFEDIVGVLENASDGDYMRINLTTNGGALHSILPLLGAMQNTECHVHIHACSDVASAGTFLLMRADTVSMNEYVTIMCHEVSFGSAGSGHTVARHVDHTLKSSEKLIRDMYEFFFDPLEIDKMLSGSDYYMDRDEFMERYRKRESAYLLANEAFEAESQAAIVTKMEQELEETSRLKKPARKKKVALNTPTE